MLTIKTKKLTGAELRSLAVGEKVYRIKGGDFCLFQFVGFMSGDSNYLILSNGKYSIHLYINKEGLFYDDWYPSSVSLAEIKTICEPAIQEDPEDDREYYVDLFDADEYRGIPGDTFDQIGPG